MSCWIVDMFAVVSAVADDGSKMVRVSGRRRHKVGGSLWRSFLVAGLGTGEVEGSRKARDLVAEISQGWSRLRSTRWNSGTSVASTLPRKVGDGAVVV